MGMIRVNKAQLIDQIASDANISKAAAGRVVDAFVATVTGSLSKGDDVALVGFGTFSVRERAARIYVTLKRVKKLKSLRRKFQLSVQARVLKTLLIAN